MIAEVFQLSRMSKSMSSGNEICIYSDTPIEILIPDAPPGELPDKERDQEIGWRFLGNNTDKPVTLAQLLRNCLPMFWISGVEPIAHGRYMTYLA